MWMTHTRRLFGAVFYGSFALLAAHYAASSGELFIRAVMGWIEHLSHYGQAGWNFDLPPPSFGFFSFIGMFAVMIGLAALIGLLVHKLPQHQPPSAHSQFESGG